MSVPNSTESTEIKKVKKKGGANKPTGSIESFWAQHSRLNQTKSFFDGAIELGFLVKAAYEIN